MGSSGEARGPGITELSGKLFAAVAAGYTGTGTGTEGTCTQRRRLVSWLALVAIPSPQQFDHGSQTN